MAGVYLYAILDGVRSLDLGPVGLPDGQGWVDSVGARGLAALVGSYHEAAVAESPRAEVLRSLAIHQRVIERAMTQRRVLPVKFGTVLASRAEASAMLTRFQHRLRSAFYRLGDAIEVEVAATWDLKRVLAEVAQERDIASMAASAAGLPPDESFAIRIQAGKLVKEALDRRREQYRSRVLRELVPWAADAQPNEILTDEMVINVAFLIKRTCLDTFYAAVHRVDAALDDQLLFRCIGPLPPYSFSSVTVMRPSAAEIEDARRLLQLGETASEREVNAAYRRLAAREHPDRNPEQSAAEERFAMLGRAKAVLRAFITGQRSSSEDNEQDRRCELTQTAVEGSLLLTIQRSAAPPIDIDGVNDALELSHERDFAAV